MDHSYHDCALEMVLQKLCRLEELILGTHAREMRKIDVETSELGQQIAAIGSGEVTQEQIEKLRAIAGRLDAIGKMTPNTEVPQ